MTKARGGITPKGTVGTFIKGRTCSDTLFHVLNREFGRPMTLEEKAAMPFAGGIMQHGYQCGMIWGAALAAGAQAYRLYGPSPRAEATAIIAAQRIVESFRARNNGNMNCLEITDIDQSSSIMKMITFFLFKGGAIGCFRMAARYAPTAFSAVSSALSEEQIEAPSPPASCAAVLAQRMGASDLHATMAAGFAGGIGLSGGACGALGAAIWIIAMSCMERSRKIAFKEPIAMDAVNRFIKCIDYEFECSDIVGRRFEDVGDHARYLRDGGCSKIIETLATTT